MTVTRSGPVQGNQKNTVAQPPPTRTEEPAAPTATTTTTPATTTPAATTTAATNGDKFVAKSAAEPKTNTSGFRISLATGTSPSAAPVPNVAALPAAQVSTDPKVLGAL